LTSLSVALRIGALERSCANSIRKEVKRMKKFSIRETETLKTTVACYCCCCTGTFTGKI
jgi:hypothetical protein